MALNLNKVILGGRLTAEPELKTTTSGLSVTTFTIAVNRKTADKKADFIECVAWRGTAEFITRYFSKGSAICVCGSLQTRTWEDKNGAKRKTVEIIVDEASFVEGKNNEETYDAPAFAKENAPKYEEVKTDEDLPF